MAKTGSTKNRKEIILLVHGIRTHAEWLEKITKILGSIDGITMVPLRYGYLDLFSFWFPIWTRMSAINRIERRVQASIAEFPDHKISLICHSFGTYAISKILTKNLNLKIQRLLLCGAIIPNDFDWNSIRNRLNLNADDAMRNSVINECGSADIWPILAKSTTFGYGNSGTYGFGTPEVTDRFHQFRHSDYFDENFVVDFWQPFFESGKIIESDWETARPSPPLGILALSFPFKWIAVLLCSVGIYTSIVTGLSLKPIGVNLQDPSGSSNRTTIVQNKIEGQGNVGVFERIETDGGDVTITTGPSLQDVQRIERLSTELGVSKAAVRTFLANLKEKQVSVDKYDQKLREIANIHKSMIRQLEVFQTDDPKVRKLKTQAKVEILSGDYSAAKSLLEEAFQVDFNSATAALEIADRRFVNAASSQFELGQIEMSSLAYIDALSHFEKAANIIPAKYPKILARYRYWLGKSAREAGQLDIAEKTILSLIDMEAKLENLEDPSFLSINLELSKILEAKDDYTGAINAYQKTKRLVDALPAGDSKSNELGVEVLTGWANVLRDKGEFSNSRAKYQEAIELAKNGNLSTSLPIQTAALYKDFSIFYIDQNDREKAIPLIEKSVEIIEDKSVVDKLLFDDYPLSSAIHDVKGTISYLDKNYEDAEQQYDKARNAAISIFGKNHHLVGRYSNNLASTLSKIGKNKEALTFAITAEENYKKSLGENHPDYGLAITTLAILRAKLGDCNSASVLFEKADKILFNALGEDHPTLHWVKQSRKDLNEC